MFPDALVKTEKDVLVDSYDEATEMINDTFNMRYEKTTLENITFCEQGYISWNGEYHPLTLWAMESLCKHAEIPFNYACDIEFPHFIYDFDQRKKTKCTSVVMCINKDAVINVSKYPLHVPRHTEVLKRFNEIDNHWPISSIRISDRGMEISMLNPSLTVDPTPGDTVQIGLRAVNSETGYKKLTCHYYTMVLRCRNGAVGMDSLGVVRWDYDKRLPIEHSLDRFFGKVEALDSEAVRIELSRIYTSLASRPLFDIELVNKWRSIKGIVGNSMADSIIGLPEERRKRLVRLVRTRDEKEPPEETTYTGYDIYNRVTDWAKKFDYVTWRRLERLAGRWLTLNGTD
jgi:hypothetical protein